MNRFLLITLVSVLSSCAMYQVDVQQGNVVEQKMLNQLEVGMPAQKVRLIMGTPLVADPFRRQRWDYLYSFQPNGKQREQRHIILFFNEDNQLIRVEGDVKVSQTPGKPTTTPEESTQPPIL